MKEIVSNFSEAKEAYKKGHFQKAKKLLDAIIDVSPLTLEGLGARFLRARGFEDGAFGSIDYEESLRDFQFLTEFGQSFRSDGFLGCARVLLALDPAKNFESAAKLAENSLVIESNVKAMMFLGSLHENYRRDEKAAEKYYLLAFKSGLPWGLRYYARLKMRRHQYIIGSLAHFMATLISPFLFSIHRIKSPMK